MTKKTDPRASNQDRAIETAFVAGTLPESDRRHTTAVMPNSGYVAKVDVLALIRAGHRIEWDGTVYTVIQPDNQGGHGVTVEDAVANIGAQILPDNDGRRFLHRTNGDVIALDPAVEAVL